nr:ATP synthase F0 subunit 6 [Aviostivalius klossi bispiniformis]
MMTNLFSIFDPMNNLNFSLNWISTMIGIIIIPNSFWLFPSRYTFFWNLILLFLFKEFKILLGINSFKGSSFIFINLFSFIMLNNFLGLFSYIFTSTSHLTLTLSLSLPMWLSFMMYGWWNNSKKMFYHLVPQGTPPILMPFMVCIETISNIIRPLTLAIRLSANMIAGHLLLTLLSNTGSSLKLMIVILIMTQILLLILEIAVSFIQSFVFAVLSTLYCSEIY